MQTEKRVVKMEAVTACDHCGKYPAIQWRFAPTGTSTPTSDALNADLCPACVERVFRAMRPVVRKPHAPKPVTAKPKRGRPKRKAEPTTAEVVAENDKLLGRN